MTDGSPLVLLVLPHPQVSAQALDLQRKLDTPSPFESKLAESESKRLEGESMMEKVRRVSLSTSFSLLPPLA